MGKKLITGLIFILLLLTEFAYIQHRLSMKLQTLERAQRVQSRQIYLLEKASRQTIRNVFYLRDYQKQQHPQKNELAGIYLAAN